MIDLLTYIAWGFGGFGLGYYLGRTAREVREIKETVMDNQNSPEPEGRATTSPASGSTPEFTAELVRRDALPWVGWLLILLAVVFVAQGVFTQIRAQNAQAERNDELRCLGEWAEDFAVAIDARTAATAATNTADHRHDQAVDDVLLAALDQLEAGGAFNDARLEKILRKFRTTDRQLDKARRENARIRAQNPYPPLPSECIK